MNLLLRHGLVMRYGILTVLVPPSTTSLVTFLRDLTAFHHLKAHPTSKLILLFHVNKSRFAINNCNLTTCPSQGMVWALLLLLHH